jgi:hypothetical protein
VIYAVYRKVVKPFHNYNLFSFESLISPLFLKIEDRKNRAIALKILYSFRNPFPHCLNAPLPHPKHNHRFYYIVFRKLSDELSTKSTWSSNLLTRERSYNVDLFQLSASTFNHFNNGCSLRAYTTNRSLYVAAGVVIAIGPQNACANCEFGVGAVGPAPRIHC